MSRFLEFIGKNCTVVIRKKLVAAISIDGTTITIAHKNAPCTNLAYDNEAKAQEDFRILVEELRKFW